MTYFLIIKSGTDYPDLDDHTEAQSKEQAIEIFLDRNSNLDRELVLRNIFNEE